MEIRQMAVVGLGTMGAGIAEVFARAGLTVIAIEADPAALERGLATLRASLDRAVSKGRLTEQQRTEIAGRVTPGGSLSAAAPADLVVEVVPERMEIKHAVFAALDEACRPDAILATNTSSLSVTAIAAGTRHPGRVAGMHFFNPAPVMRLVEVISTEATEPAVTGAVAGLAGRLGKSPVQVADRAGFVANALLLPYLNHAVALLEAGLGSREDIDAALTAAAGLPMGPLALLDLIGLDTALSIMEVLGEAFGGTRYTPAPLLRRLVAAGQLGRKSGRGIFDYAGGPGTGPQGIVLNEAAQGTPATMPPGAVAGREPLAAVTAAAAGVGLPGDAGQAAPDLLAAVLLYPHIADAARMVQDGYASAADVDAAMTLGCGYPRGPLQLADEAGPARVAEALAAMHAASGDPAFSVPRLLSEHAAARTGFRD
jgi:3-hydroxybutyryl-CoA dehydrogenase